MTLVAGRLSDLAYHAMALWKPLPIERWSTRWYRFTNDADFQFTFNNQFIQFMIWLSNEGVNLWYDYPIYQRYLIWCDSTIYSMRGLRKSASIGVLIIGPFRKKKSVLIFGIGTNFFRGLGKYQKIHSGNSGISCPERPAVGFTGGLKFLD